MTSWTFVPKNIGSNDVLNINRELFHVLIKLLGVKAHNTDEDYEELLKNTRMLKDLCENNDCPNMMKICFEIESIITRFEKKQIFTITCED